MTLLKMPGKNRIQCNLYFCKKCCDQNWLIECACGRCNDIITRFDKWDKPRRFKGRHNKPRRTNVKGWYIRNDYIFIYAWDRPNCDKRGYVQLHRLIMEDILGRYLTKEEVVHHIDGNRINNFEENLELIENNIIHLTTKHSTTKDHSNTRCRVCGGARTRIRTENGRPNWCGNEIDGFLCSKCYEKIRNKKRKRVKGKYVLLV